MGARRPEDSLRVAQRTAGEVVRRSTQQRKNRVQMLLQSVRQELAKRTPETPPKRSSHKAAQRALCDSVPVSTSRKSSVVSVQRALCDRAPSRGAATSREKSRGAVSLPSRRVATPAR